MIFVISDIHGMLDALKNLIWQIEDKSNYGKNVEELIFLGDSNRILRKPGKCGKND